MKVAYTKDGNIAKSKNTYCITDTDLYKTAKDSSSLSDVWWAIFIIYLSVLLDLWNHFRKNIEKNMKQIEERIIPKLQIPLKWLFLERCAHCWVINCIQMKQNLWWTNTVLIPVCCEVAKPKTKSLWYKFSGVQEIAHALYAQHFSSKAKYLDYYKKNIVGKATTDPSAFPEYQLAKTLAKQTSKVGLFCCHYLWHLSLYILSTEWVCERRRKNQASSQLAPWLSRICASKRKCQEC